MMKIKKSEQGQIIVILALAMVAILGITALAIDGSLIYNERRQDQSTADSLALSGAGAAAQYLKDATPGVNICGTSVGTVATQKIVDNIIATVETDYREEFNIPDGTVVSTADLMAYMPKLPNEASLAVADRGYTITCNAFIPLGVQYLDVHVKMSTTMPTTFARVVSQNTLKTTIDATARVYPKQPLAYGFALAALDKTQCAIGSGGIFITGSSEVFINHGGMISNTCIDARSIVDVLDGFVKAYWSDGCKNYSPSHNEPKPWVPCTKSNDLLQKDMILPPQCPAKTTANTNNLSTYSGIQSPGWYTNGLEPTNNLTLELLPGLYCIEGDMTINSKSNLKGSGVTLYFKSGSFNMNENHKGFVQLSSCAADAGCGAAPWSAVQGLLMYVNPEPMTSSKINGGSTNSFVGTIFAPGTDITFNGNSETTTPYQFNAQVIGNSIKINGNSEVRLELDTRAYTKMPPSLSLIK